MAEPPKRPLTDAEVRDALNHLQAQLNFLAHCVGEALSLLADHAGARDAIDRATAVWSGTASRGVAATRIMERLQKGLETPAVPLTPPPNRSGESR